MASESPSIIPLDSQPLSSRPTWPLDVCEAPWTRILTVEQGAFSPEERRFRIMLAIRNLVIDCDLVRPASEEGPPLDFPRRASIVFSRLPSGYFALVVRSKRESGEYHSFICTEVAFNFNEEPPMVGWTKDRVKFSLLLNTSDEFWALNRCVQLARIDRECTPVMQLARDELQTLQERLEHLERVAFLATLEQSTTAA